MLNLQCVIKSTMICHQIHPPRVCKNKILRRHLVAVFLINIFSFQDAEKLLEQLLREEKKGFLQVETIIAKQSCCLIIYTILQTLFPFQLVVIAFYETMPRQKVFQGGNLIAQVGKSLN